MVVRSVVVPNVAMIKPTAATIPTGQKVDHKQFVLKVLLQAEYRRARAAAVGTRTTKARQHDGGMH